VIEMQTKEQVIKKVGLSLWEAMNKTGFLDGITVRKNPDGTIEIPEEDIDRAYRAANGEIISDWD
jgi:hypothetical protein